MSLTHDLKDAIIATLFRPNRYTVLYKTIREMSHYWQKFDAINRQTHGGG